MGRLLRPTRAAVVAHVRSGDVSIVRDASMMDRLATRIAVGVIALTTVGAPVGLRPSSGPVRRNEPGRDQRRSPRRTRGRRRSGRVASAEHTVRPGDTIWSIAEERLADRADWTTIAALNLGTRWKAAHGSSTPTT